MASGVSRESIRDASRVTGLFSFYNRWIDGSGVPEMDPASYAASAKGLAQGGYGPPASPVRPLRQPVRRADLSSIARELAAGNIPRRLTTIAASSPGLAAFTGKLLGSSSTKLPRPMRRTIAALAFGEPLGVVDADALVAGAGGEKERALLGFVRKLGSRAHDIDQADISALNRAGWSDRALYDAITIAALFSNFSRTLHVESLLSEIDRD
jgi:hypothetical protein